MVVALVFLFCNIKKEGGKVTCKALADDIFLIGQPSDLAIAYEELETQTAALNLTVQPSKCELVYFHQDTYPLPDEFMQFLDQRKITLSLEMTTILGAPIGKDMKRMEAMALKMVETQAGFFTSLQDPAMPSSRIDASAPSMRYSAS